MGVTAYAAGLFGTEALEIKDPFVTPQKLEIGKNGWGYMVDNAENGAVFSITQPQDLPETVSPEVRERIENNRAAWEEWEAWFQENRLTMPDVFNPPENSSKSDLRENGDGSWTLVFSRPNKTRDELYDWGVEIEEVRVNSPSKAAEMEEEYQAYLLNPDNWILLEERVVSAEEKERYDIYRSVQGKFQEGHDYYYHVQTPDQGKKLEEIAARYGLSLRGEQVTLFGRTDEYYQVHKRPDWMTDELYKQEVQSSIGSPTRENLAVISRQCCRGDLFLTPPPYVDHLYWYDEGTFAVDFTWVTDSGMLAECYLYNSMYATLSSGHELFDEIEDISSYTSRSYLTRDGTEVTILESNHLNAWGWHDASYLFVYLDDSFLVVKIHQEEGLTSEELDQIADSIQYSVINL